MKTNLNPKWNNIILLILFQSLSLPVYSFSGVLETLNGNTNSTKVWILITILILATAIFFFIIWKQRHILQEKNQALINAKQKAENLAKVKSEFLAVMSHEIRTPMNGVIGMANVLSTDCLSREQKENLDILKFSANNLLILINDILDLEKMESGKIGLEKTEFSLRDFCHQSFMAFKNAQGKSNNDFVLETNFEGLENYVLGDPHRLNQVMANLATNALKFTKNGKVTAKVNLVSLNNLSARVKFEMIDTGIGISKDNQKSIFEKYTQAESNTTRIYGGTGLGLNIAKEIVELYNSELKLESEVGEGSNFHFVIDFPLGKKIEISAKATSQIAGKPYRGKAELEGMRILLAEDNKINQLVAKRILTEWGVKLIIAQDGQEAVDIYKEKQFELILMDIQMPNLDGYEATKAIRSFPCAKKEIPIIALTASALTIEKAEENQMDGYIGKPFNPKDLLNTLKQFHKCEAPILLDRIAHTRSQSRS